MHYLFFKHALDIHKFDTSNVTDMSYMFYGCRVNELDLSSFNTENVTDMSYMFNECSVKKLDLSSFNVSNVTDMNYMFQGCQAKFIKVKDFKIIEEIKTSHDIIEMDNLGEAIEAGSTLKILGVTNTIIVVK